MGGGVWRGVLGRGLYGILGRGTLLGTLGKPLCSWGRMIREVVVRGLAGTPGSLGSDFWASLSADTVRFPCRHW